MDMFSFLFLFKSWGHLTLLSFLNSILSCPWSLAFSCVAFYLWLFLLLFFLAHFSSACPLNIKFSEFHLDSYYLTCLPERAHHCRGLSLHVVLMMIYSSPLSCRSIIPASIINLHLEIHQPCKFNSPKLGSLSPPFPNWLHSFDSSTTLQPSHRAWNLWGYSGSGPPPHCCSCWVIRSFFSTSQIHPFFSATSVSAAIPPPTGLPPSGLLSVVNQKRYYMRLA